MALDLTPPPLQHVASHWHHISLASNSGSRLAVFFDRPLRACLSPVNTPRRAPLGSLLAHMLKKHSDPITPTITKRITTVNRLRPASATGPLVVGSVVVVVESSFHGLSSLLWFAFSFSKCRWLTLFLVVAGSVVVSSTAYLPVV